MRNLLLSLLLANILVFLWGQLSDGSDEPGISEITDSNLGPPLELATPADPGADVAVGNVANGGQSSELSALVGRACVSIGPFRETADAETAKSDLEADGMRASIRTTQGEIFVGHWVQILNVPDRATADSMLARLREGGMTEAYMVRTDDEGIKISLGLFDDMSGAERTELQAESLGLSANVTERMRDATVFYVDVGLPPGRGAGNMIEQYGEDRVLLRGAARCPRTG